MDACYTPPHLARDDVPMECVSTAPPGWREYRWFTYHFNLRAEREGRERQCPCGGCFGCGGGDGPVIKKPKYLYGTEAIEFMATYTGMARRSEEGDMMVRQMAIYLGDEASQTAGAPALPVGHVSRGQAPRDYN